MAGIWTRPKGPNMQQTQGASNCRWAVPTLFLSTPGWTEAEARPWSCLRDEAPVEMESTSYCGRCVRWEPRAESAVAFGDDAPTRFTGFFLDVGNNAD